ncbi:VanZ family protein [Gracilibacillus sp. S3-1-1]|uniref:VanZ family protein n=1 Tax=Gracilibacillus pellucidus TaxID=3095368 RepID=A0ACC6M1K0_9BACI|nr:VanZ family protein [Gracilibacillus sp. S3-1-1]MDX8044826.1 VanZ family protein [Gracilibacillus sp. S3-1-1]
MLTIKSLIKYSFIIYVIGVMHLSLDGISIPPKVTWIKYQLIPFHFVYDWYIEAASGSWFLLNSIKLTFYNYLLLLPQGFYLGLLFHVKSKRKALMLVFCTTLCIETSQLLLNITGFGYRTFNVNDLMVNTLGGITGYGGWLLFKKIRAGSAD